MRPDININIALIYCSKSVISLSNIEIDTIIQLIDIAKKNIAKQINPILFFTDISSKNSNLVKKFLTAKMYY